MNDDYVIKRYDQRIIPVDCYNYNSSIVTEHYHERSILRVFELKPVFIFFFYYFFFFFYFFVLHRITNRIYIVSLNFQNDYFYLYLM